MRGWPRKRFHDDKRPSSFVARPLWSVCVLAAELPKAGSKHKNRERADSWPWAEISTPAPETGRTGKLKTSKDKEDTSTAAHQLVWLTNRRSHPPAEAHTLFPGHGHVPSKPRALLRQVAANVRGVKQRRVRLTTCLKLEVSLTMRCPGNLKYLEIHHRSKKSQGILENTLNWMILTTYQNLCAAVKVLLGGKFIPLNAYIRKE